MSAHSFCSADFTDEDTENGGEKVREEKVRVEKDGGKSNWYLSVITGVPIIFIFAIPAGVIIYKRLKKCMKSPEKHQIADLNPYLFPPEWLWVLLFHRNENIFVRLLEIHAALILFLSIYDGSKCSV